jgi:carbonic anhydrase
MGETTPVRLSRRDLLRLGVSAASAGFVSTSLGLIFPAPAQGQSTLTPRAALDELIAGNKRFLSGRFSAHEQDLRILRQRTEQKQQPFAAVLSCADSRVPVELVFDQTIGQVFVTRIAGNVATSEIIASLEYAAAVLGTKAILVLGHSHCGAVKAAIEGKAVPGAVSALFPHLQPAVDRAGSDVELAGKANARLQAALLRRSSVVLSSMVKAGNLLVVAGYYDLGTGAVEILEQ